MTRKQLLDIRTAITNLDLDAEFYVNDSAEQDVLLTQDQAQIPDTWKTKRQRYGGQLGGTLMKLRWRVKKPPLTSDLLANVQSLETIILCFTMSWLHEDVVNINLSGFSMHRQDRTAASRKLKSGGVCLFVRFQDGVVVQTCFVRPLMYICIFLSFLYIFLFYFQSLLHFSSIIPSGNLPHPMR
jgi:hypothetical protein